MITKRALDEISDYLTDASCYVGFCDNLLIPETIDEIVEIVRNANQTGRMLTISSAGTGLTGSRVPLGGDVISMERFDKILNFSKENKTLTVEPYVRLNEIQDFLNGTGLFYPPNPTEKLASIGGNIGNNASGSRTYIYGSSRDYINKLGIILPCGDTLNLSRGQIFADGLKFSFRSNEGNGYSFDMPEIEMPKVKHAAGYFIKPDMDLIDLFIGAEGTLGIITSIELRLLDSPENVLGAIIFLDDFDKMYALLEYLKSNSDGISPRLIEYFDDNSLDFLRSKISQIPDLARYALWIEIEVNETNSDDTTAALYQAITEYSSLADETWIALSDADHKRLAEFRHALPLAVYEKIQEYKQQKLGTDTAVPSKYLKEYHEFMISLFKREKLDYVIWGHIGNSHLHANIITKSDEEFVVAKELFDIIVERAVELGGTVSAEHGIGKIKKRYLKMLYNEEVINGFRSIKKAVDPKMIMNKGNVFD